MSKKKSEVLANRVNWGLEIGLTVAGFTFTLIALFFLSQDLVKILLEKISTGNAIEIIEQVAFIGIVSLLIYGNIVYLMSRLGFLLRDKNHQKEEESETLYLFSGNAPSLSILVPSYKEELRVIHQTLLSAALQQYPDKRIVLLIDDDPAPVNSEDKKALEGVQLLPHQISEFLEMPRRRYQKEKENFLHRLETTGVQRNEFLNLSALYDNAAGFLESYAGSYRISDHTDRLFVEKVLLQPAQEHRDSAQSFKERAESTNTSLDTNELIAHYNRLIAQFTAELSSFQRKRYENLSHEKNKAMNLNSYIGIMGKSLYETERNGHLFLEESDEFSATIKIPDSEYIITLDADSILLPTYALRLMHTMNKQGNHRLAVIQTPYSAIPGSSNILERVAGATTDIQLLIHQGFTWNNATFWVGANAMVRKAALEAIKVIVEERGYPVTCFIQDRTVIEDTESTIDLVEAGWTLSNYPARMAYSATPPDYGSLLIQRRRCANGGLIIMPKLIRHIVKNPSFKKTAEGFVRLSYLVSIAATSGGVLILILYPFEDVMRTLWLPLLSLPYFYLYGRDLKLSGYGWLDLPRVYALNLMLVPVNLGGVLKSIQQGITREKIPFVRTPKIENRTAAPPLYIISTVLIFAYCLFSSAYDSIEARWMHAIFSALNAAFLGYACTYYLGWKNGLEDIATVWKNRVKKNSLTVEENLILPLLNSKVHFWKLGPVKTSYKKAYNNFVSSSSKHPVRKRKAA